MIANNFKELLECVACKGKNLIAIIDLGYQPLANNYSHVAGYLEKYPLKLMHCTMCSHSQLSIAVNPSILFKNYLYVSGTSDTLDNYFDSLKNQIIKKFGPVGKILDIGSNDGSFLAKFNNTNWLCLGVDPAVNLLQSSLDKGVVTLPTFFDQKLAELLANNFDVIIAMNSFAHTGNPLEVLLGIKKCLKDNGIAIIQTSQSDMFLNGQFDTVYHEHISFFNVKSMKFLLNRAGLFLSKVSINPIHGNSYVWEISKKSDKEIVHDREKYELSLGLYSEPIYKEFTKVAYSRVQNVITIVNNFRAKGFLINSYGAAAKGNTFINFANLKLDFILDETPQKIGLFSPAGGVKVSHPDVLKKIDSPILFLIPAWNFKNEILSKIRAYRRNSMDEYLIYFPEIIQEKVFR